MEKIKDASKELQDMFEQLWQEYNNLPRSDDVKGHVKNATAHFFLKGRESVKPEKLDAVRIKCAPRIAVQLLESRGRLLALCNNGKIYRETDDSWQELDNQIPQP